jgi:hypothetical protein
MMRDPFLPGQAYRSLGYNYQLPARGYTADKGWNGWDLATAQYGGNGRGRVLERDWFDTIVRTPSSPCPGLIVAQVNRVGSYFSVRRMSESQAREAHQRLYHFQEPERMGYAEISSNTLGGAAAFEAFLLWDRDYHGVYESMPHKDNRDRLVSMAVGEGTFRNPLMLKTFDDQELIPLMQCTHCGNDSVSNRTIRYRNELFRYKTRQKRQRRQRKTCSTSTTCGTNPRDTADGAPPPAIPMERVTTPVRRDTTTAPPIRGTIRTPDTRTTDGTTDTDTDTTTTTDSTPTWPLPQHSSIHEKGKPHIEAPPQDRG